MQALQRLLDDDDDDKPKKKSRGFLVFLIFALFGVLVVCGLPCGVGATLHAGRTADDAVMTTKPYHGHRRRRGKNRPKVDLAAAADQRWRSRGDRAQEGPNWLFNIARPTKRRNATCRVAWSTCCGPHAGVLRPPRERGGVGHGRCTDPLIACWKEDGRPQGRHGELGT